MCCDCANSSTDLYLARRYRITTDSDHNYLVVDNIIDRAFTQTKPGKAWVSDMTYIAVKEGIIYLTTITDLFDRKVIGWSLSWVFRSDRATYFGQMVPL
ncbi:hypothetical protein ACPDHL_07760 [Myroides sp. C15-4]|uniref:hypothetical protein n=1 Tax=Myroides sp. C15-4 TaxID=3400532 RepID=UPI003D2F687E